MDLVAAEQNERPSAAMAWGRGARAYRPLGGPDACSELATPMSRRDSGEKALVMAVVYGQAWGCEGNPPLTGCPRRALGKK